MRIQSLGLLNELLKYSKTFLPSDATAISLNEFKMIEEQGADSEVYSFILTYVSKGLNQRKEFALKLYRQRGKSARALSSKEFAILEALKECSFPVPEAYYLNISNTINKKPFIIMEKIPGKSALSFLNDEAKAKVLVDKMAQILSRLHKLDPNCIPESSVLREQYELEQRNLLTAEIFMKKTPRRFFRNCSSRQLRFLAAVKRLENLKPKKFQPAILHMDYTPGHFVVSNRRFAIVDWTDVVVGDPAFDVALAYHYLRIGREREKLDLGEHFINSYTRHAGKTLTNIQICKDRVILKLALRSGLSLFQPSAFSFPIRSFVSLTFGNVFRKLAQASFRHHYQRSMATHHNIVLRNLDDIQNYIIRYMEKDRYSAM